MSSAEAPAGRLLSAHLPPDLGDTVVCLQPSTPGVLAAVQAGRGAAPLYVAHRRLPEASRLRAHAEQQGWSHVVVAHGLGRLAVHADTVADAVVMELPSDRMSGLLLLLDALRLLREDGRLLLVGGTREGIKPAVQRLEATGATVRTLGHGGGHRLVEARRTAQTDEGSLVELVAPFDDPAAFRRLDVELSGIPAVLFTRPGVFSWDALDEATALLASVMSPPARGAVLDLGCGAGALGLAVRRRAPGCTVTLVDADSEAVRCAERTLQEHATDSWRVLPSDVASAVSHERFDLVVSNPPFHVGKTTDLDLPRRFIAEAHDVLHTGGRLQLVANRTLPYEGELERVFGNRRTLHDGARFKVLEAIRR